MVEENVGKKIVEEDVEEDCHQVWGSAGQSRSEGARERVQPSAIEGALFLRHRPEMIKKKGRKKKCRRNCEKAVAEEVRVAG